MSQSAFSFSGVLLILTAVVLSGHAGLWNGFLNYDDPDVILKNPRLDRPSIVGAVEIFGEIRDYAYLPFYYLGLMPEAALAGLDPQGFHAASLLWHALNGVLVFWLVSILTLSRFGALATALLFVLHPVAVESVAWASGRKDQVSLALLLSGLGLWAAWLLRPRRGILWTAITLMFLSCFAKGSTVVFPLLAAAVARYMKRTGRSVPDVQPLGPLVVMAVLAVIPIGVHLWVASSEGTAGEGASHTATAGLFLLLHALQRYGQHLVLPLQLSIHYPPGDPASVSVAGLLVLAALLSGPVLLWRSRFSSAGLALSWILTSLLPFNNVFPRTSVTVADRYLTVGLPAFAFLVGLGLNRLPPAIKVLALVALCLALGFLTDARTRQFKDGVAVFESAMRAEPEDPFPPAQLAEALLERASKDPSNRVDREKALERLAVSLGLAERQGNPVQILRTRLRYADTLLRLRRFPAALDHFDLARSEYGRSPSRFSKLGVEPLTIEHNRAVSLVGLGLITDARSTLESVLAQDPMHPETRLLLGQIEIRAGFENLAVATTAEVRDRSRHAINRGISGMSQLIAEAEAQRRNRRGGRITEDTEVRARTELARTLLKADWKENPLVEALGQAEYLITRHSGRPEGWALRAELKEIGGDRRGAVDDLAQAFDRDPSDQGVLLRIVRHLRLAGENRRAVELLRRGLRDNPEAKLLKQELASIYVAQAGAHRNSRELDKAHFAATSACDLDPENAEAHAALGAVQEARHRWEAAGDCYQRALALDTGLDEARRGLARFHQARGIAALSEIRTRVEKAPEAERKAVEQNLRDLVMADFRQALDLAAGSPDVEIARRHVREAERGEIREASRALCDRARKDLEAGRLPEATELLRQAVRVDGTHHDAHYLLAQALAGQDDLDGALQSLEQVLSLDPEHFPALAVSARLYYVKGRNDEARKAGERALMLLKDEEARHAFPEEITMLKRILDLSKPPGR